MKLISPIALFVYNRPWHTQQTIEALQKNELVSSSKLFVFSDGPKGEQDEIKVKEVRDYIKSIQGFNDLQIIERESNWGLADNIIDGVTQIVNTYGRVIVLEDDLVTSPYFLRFMNEALEFYKDEKKVWHISGWNYPIDLKGLPDTFLWRVMNCWGWATWAERWQYFERDPEKLVRDFSKEEIKRFNLDGAHNFWGQVKGNVEGRIRTWAIFWYATIFKNDGLCLNPTQKLVQNIGHDGSGTHCGKSTFDISVWNNKSLPKLELFELIEHDIALKRLTNHLKSIQPSCIRLIARKLIRMVIR
ncbi:MAG: sugar transferase [Desulfovermiculus sp.]|nr:sugar transferase [Desulfovermiculus sp.]